MFIQKRRIVADDEIDETMTDTAGDGQVEVDPEATDLLFEAEDVAELVAEVTGEAVDVTVDDDSVTFAVGDDEYTVEAEGDEEMLEASTKIMKGKRRVAASTRRVPARKPAQRRVAASKQTRPVRRVGRR
nr:MAG TPA: hypothetical protein [Caudoviricetes sp.]